MLPRTTVSHQRTLACAGLAVTALVAGVLCRPVVARSLDQRGEIRIGARLYTAARVGTEQTHVSDRPGILSQSFPPSAAGHVRQLRAFLEVEWDHDLSRLARQGFGPLALLSHLPFRVRGLRYHLAFRGEGEGIYDWGPREFRTAAASENFVDPLTGKLPPEVVGELRRRLRRLGVHRERLFLAFVDAEVGRLFLRLGRQILAWGETDAFRLLDNINPIDNSFGGFLVSLDERRVPLDMLRANYYLGPVGPATEVFVEGFAAIDDAVGFSPGIPRGSPWMPANLGIPSLLVKPVLKTRPRTVRNTRGGVQVKGNVPLPLVGETTLGVAHYYTYFDVPVVDNHTFQDGFIRNVPGVFPDDDPQGAGFPNGPLGSRIKAVTSPQRVQVTGLSATFAVPAHHARRLWLSGEPVVRFELAYFHREPRFTQAQLDPFVIHQRRCVVNPDGSPVAPGTECRGGKRVGDSWNLVLGVDFNQYLRFLNQHQSFFFSTQFFYKHLNGAARRRPLSDVNGDGVPDPQFAGVSDGEVLPVPELFRTDPTGNPGQPIFVRNPVDQFLQTLIITTTYRGGQIVPVAAFIYDWSGAFVFQPGVTFVHDPFRFTISYSLLAANRLKGASGISLLRDRDNVLFQLEFVL